MEALRTKLQQEGIETETSHPLAPHSTFRLGGAADLALFPKSRAELCRALELLRDAGVPSTVIGGGSNVVFPDEGLRGATVFTSACRALALDGERITAEAGVRLSALATAACEAGLGGAEFAHGIPGTVGGAVFMNAGAFGGSIADICIKSDYYDTKTGEIVTLCGDAQAFGNRTSAYEKNPHRIILGATFLLHPASREEILAIMQDLMSRRRRTQPLEFPSAGSVFKRPEGHFAGKLIEDCGLKGYRIGGAEVSEKHAGFIINRGGATAADVRALVAHIKETVLRETGVTLECEIKFL